MPALNNLAALQDDLKKHGIDAKIEPTLPERASFKEAQKAVSEYDGDDDKEYKKLLATLKARKQEYLTVFHEHVAAEYPTLLYERGEDKVFWTYNEDTGVYDELTYAIVRGYVLSLLIEEDMKESAKETVAKDVLARYRAVYTERGVRYEDFDAEDAWFHAANGWVHLDTLAFEDHTPERLSLRVSAVAYDKDATCPTYDMFIDEDIQLKKDEVRVLDQFSGLILTRDMRHQKMLTIIGRPGSGKSTLIELWREVLGDMAVQLHLNEVVGDNARFIGGELAGRTLCWFDEVEPKKSEFDNALGEKITGSTITIERKGINGRPKVPNYLKNILTANSLPYASTQGIYRRIIYIEFNHSFTSDGTVDRDLPTKLRSEMSGVLNRMLRGLADMRKMGGFTVIEGQEDRIEEYKVSSDPIAEFLDTYFDPIPEWVEGVHEPINSKDMFEAFKVTMGDLRWVHLTPQKFGRMLAYQPVERFHCMKSVRTMDARQWKGVALKRGYEWQEMASGALTIVESRGGHTF